VPLAWPTSVPPVMLMAQPLALRSVTAPATVVELICS
jgi:hypothetical protein